MNDRVKKIGYGVIGLGNWGETHIKTLLSDSRVNLLGVCDVNGERAKEVAVKYKIPNYFTSYDEMLKNSEIESVSVATPDFAHAAPALSIVQSGRDLLVEKPMAMTIKECVEIIKAAKRSGVKLMVDMHNRWSPPFFKAYDSLKRGMLGNLEYIYFRLSDILFIPTEYVKWAAKTNVLWFLGPHAIDTVRWLFDDEVKEVYAVNRKGTILSKGIDIPDFYVLILEFENGGIANLEHSWILSSSLPSPFDLKCSLQGSDGTIYIDTSHNRMLEKYVEQTEKSLDTIPYQDTTLDIVVHGRQLGFATESIRHFVDCIWQNKKPLVGGIDGLRTTEIILAAEESARIGRPVKVVRNII